jgi:hypothetical protein
MNWDDSVVTLLNDVKNNSTYLNEYHRKSFFHYKGLSTYFRIPVIVLSSFSASFSVGSQPYLEQGIISLVGCFIGFMITIISSIELYLNIDQAKTLELAMAKDFYALSIDINKMLTLNANDRGEDGISYLNKKYNQYQDYVRRSNLLSKKFRKDKLVQIEMMEINTEEETNYEESPRETNMRTLSKFKMKKIVDNEPWKKFGFNSEEKYNESQNMGSSTMEEIVDHEPWKKIGFNSEEEYNTCQNMGSYSNMKETVDSNMKEIIKEKDGEDVPV